MAALSNAFIIGHFVFFRRAALLKSAEPMDCKSHVARRNSKEGYNTSKEIVKK